MGFVGQTAGFAAGIEAAAVEIEGSAGIGDCYQESQSVVDTGTLAGPAPIAT